MKMLKIETRHKAGYRGSREVVTEADVGRLHDRLRKCFQVAGGRRREQDTSKESLSHRGQSLGVPQLERNCKGKGRTFEKMRDNYLPN